MKVVTAQLPDEMIRSLDTLSATEGRSKAWLIRQALTDFLAKQKELDQLTMEGLQAARSGDLVEHEEVMAELDQWGR